MPATAAMLREGRWSDEDEGSREAGCEQSL
jgi:hypothetical protein